MLLRSSECIFRKVRHTRIDISLNLARLSFEKNTRIDIFCYVATFVRHIFRKERNTRIEISLNLANMLPDVSFEKNTRIEISSNLAVLPRSSDVSFEKRGIRELKYLRILLCCHVRQNISFEK